jgi:hypothetical protein
MNYCNCSIPNSTPRHNILDKSPAQRLQGHIPLLPQSHSMSCNVDLILPFGIKKFNFFIFQRDLFLIILFFELKRFMKKNIRRKTQGDQKKTFSEVSYKWLDRRMDLP